MLLAASAGERKGVPTVFSVVQAIVIKGMWCSWLSRSLSMREGSGSIPDMSIMTSPIANLFRSTMGGL